MTLKVFSHSNGRQQITGKKDEKTDKKETIKRISSGNADCLRSGNVRWMRTKDRKYREYSYFPYSTGADRKNGAKIPFLVRTNADRKYGSFICRSVFCHLLWEENYALVIIGEDEKFLVVPEGEPVPEDLPEDITPLLQPLTNMYLAATSAMDFFCHLDAVDQITLSGTDRSGWYLEEPKKALEEGTMEYAGKYSAPDYERIVDKSCSLAIESTMIYHCPQVKEQLENLGVPVLVERSSYEADPLGRMEWIKLYGVLTGKEQLAEELFEKEIKELENVSVQADEGQEHSDQTNQGKTVAFFYITSKGSANVRKPGDYVAKMITMAGGTYVPQSAEEEEENALSTMNMEMEAFYAKAKDADYIIYNSTIDGELTTMDEFLAKSPLLADFKAVKEGHVWCTGKNLFQETMGLGNMIQDIHRMLTEETPDEGQMHYIHQLK